MTETRKAADAKTIEGDRQFLDRHNVKEQMRDVLSKIVENRPEDPIAFLADYFETLNEKTNRILKAYQQLSLTHHTRPAFESNARIAYDLLSQTKSGKPSRGITGKIYNDLLLMICKNYPAGTKDQIMNRIQGRDHEVIRFVVFRSGVYTCFVLQDFLKQAESLYTVLDITKKEEADESVCNSVVKQFTEAVTTSGEDPFKVLEAGHMLGPEKLFSAVGRALMTTNPEKVIMKKEDFLVLMSQAFILKIPDMR